MKEKTSWSELQLLGQAGEPPTFKAIETVKLKLTNKH